MKTRTYVMGAIAALSVSILGALAAVTQYNTLTRPSTVERQLAELRSPLAQGVRPGGRGGRPQPPPPKAPVSLEGAATKGRADAPVVLIQYSDFQCPYCAVFARDVLPQLEREYVTPGKLLVAFRHLPIDSLHPFARKAAVAAECAGEQGAFWRMHDRLFAARLDEAVISTIADELNLRGPRFTECLSGDAGRKVERDVSEAKRMGINGTPALLIGESLPEGQVQAMHLSIGALGFQALQSIIDGILRSKS